MKQFIFILSLGFFYLSCQKEVTVVKDDFDLAIEKVNLDCTGNTDSIFFRASINGKDYCMSSDKFAAKANAGVGTFNSFSVFFYSAPGNTSYKPIFIIDAPIGNTNLSNIARCDQFLQKGASFPVTPFGEAFNSKFRITMEVDEQNTDKVNSSVSGPGGSITNISGASIYNSVTNSGDQATTANIVFDDVIRTERLTNVTYAVKGHFNCKLYRSNAPDIKGKLIWDVQNAQFKFSLSVTK